MACAGAAASASTSTTAASTFPMRATTRSRGRACGRLLSRNMSDENNAVLTERRDGVLLITLNRPDARNAVNMALAAGVAAALDDLDASDDVSVGVLTGAGKGFSSGMDLK